MQNVPFDSPENLVGACVVSVATPDDACPAEATGWVQRISISRTGRERPLDGGKVLCVK